MKRVASLYLPDWPIERLTQAERSAAPPDAASFDPRLLAEQVAREQAVACSVPRGGGWRPGARWARTEDAARPRNRRTGRTSEAAPHPFKAMPPDEGGTVVQDARVTTDSPPWKGGVGGGSLAMKRDARPIPTHPRPSVGSALPLAGPEQRGALFTRHSSREGRNSAALVVPPTPRVTSQQQGNKLIIAAACPVARALGLVPGMAVTQARALVPELDIRPADPDGDGDALLRLAMLAARRWCPLVMPSGADGLLLDISGTAHLFGGEARMARRMVRMLARRGFTARVAVADTPGVAWALARFGGGGATIICPPAAHFDAIAPLPTAALRLDPRAIDLLKRLGVETVGQLAALPRAPLARRFGGDPIRRLDQASGRLPEPLEPVVPPEQILVTRRFAEPIATADAIEHWLRDLMPRLVTALAQAGQGARAIELVADRIDGVPQRLRIGLARPTRDAAHLLRLTLRRIEEIAPGYGIDALTLHVRRADPLGAQPFAETLEVRTPDLTPLIDTLANRIGSDQLWRTTPQQSDVPERSVVAVAPLDPPPRAVAALKPDDVRQLDRSTDVHPWHPRWPRPVRLLRRPELLDNVLAALPDQPPRRFTWRGKTHRVVRADGPERITGEWWKRATERHSVRDYFRVEDELGERFWLFRRGDGERSESGDLAWFMHGSFG